MFKEKKKGPCPGMPRLGAHRLDTPQPFPNHTQPFPIYFNRFYIYIYTYTYKFIYFNIFSIKSFILVIWWSYFGLRVVDDGRAKAIRPILLQIARLAQIAKSQSGKTLPAISARLDVNLAFRSRRKGWRLETKRLHLIMPDWTQSA